ncbi:hypothetical protein EW145_g1827 [Phellinidium pouzarii]|uniref:Uncharacterized protein n=1 Tax=Phellinidium pouzarii TaxID=167371 RepID=A0A4S4LEX1_9AGAM|nr:hypothetical protein EW145_g1827 [Phellinidium pouzarii]
MSARTSSHINEERSEKGLSAPANHDLEDRELLRRISRLLPGVGDQSFEQAKSEGYSISSRTSRFAVRLAETEPLRISRAPRVDLLRALEEFESKYSRVQSKLSQLQKILRMAAEGNDVSKAAAKATVHLEGVGAYLKQYVDSLAMAEIGPPPEVPELNLSSALTSLSLSCRLLFRTLISISEFVIDCDELQPLEDLAQLAESDSMVIKENKANNRTSGIRVRQHAADLLLHFSVPVLMKRQHRESSKHLAMTCITVLFSIVTAIMFSSSADQPSSALDFAVSGFWIVSLACGIAAAITSVLGLVWWESASDEVRYAPGKTVTWLGKGSAFLFIGSTILFSIGLCLFAFASFQAVATRAVVVVFSSLHVLALLVLLARIIRKHREVEGRVKRAWKSMRRLTQVSIRASVFPTDKIGVKDVEQGLHSKDKLTGNLAATVGDRPVIQVTDTEPVSGFATIGETSSEPDLARGSFLRSNLTVPVARRMSSDSSRSLPSLPPDVQIVRCMQYSPNGMFLCIGNSCTQERCTIFSADSPAIILGELKLEEVAQQIEWSPDGENILFRLSHMTYLWNAMPSNSARRPTFVIHREAETFKWLPQSDSFLTCETNVLTKFDLYGEPKGVFQIPVANIQDFIVTQDGIHVVCLTTVNSSARSGISAKSATRLVVCNLENNMVEYTQPIGSDAHTIVRSLVASDVILINFLGNTPPQLWQYFPVQAANASEKRISSLGLIFKRVMSFNLKMPSSGRFSGKGIFGGTEDKLVLSLGENGDMFVFAHDSGQLLRHINSPQSSDQPKGSIPRSKPLAQCVAWDPDILSFAACVAFADGSIWQWKMAFDDLSQSSSSFAVMTLDDEDLTMIRAGDSHRHR